MKPTILEFIKPIVTKLQNLTPGQSLLFKAKTPTHLNRTRNLLYAYFREQNISSSFSIRREPNLQMRVVCKEAEPLTLVQEQPFTPVEKFVQNHLLDCASKTEATTIILAAARKGLCTDSDVVPILVEWTRLQGEEAVAKANPLNGIGSNPWEEKGE